jgi:hypothetical protein
VEGFGGMIRVLYSWTSHGGKQILINVGILTGWVGHWVRRRMQVVSAASCIHLYPSHTSLVNLLRFLVLSSATYHSGSGWGSGQCKRHARLELTKRARILPSWMFTNALTSVQCDGVVLPGWTADTPKFSHVRAIPYWDCTGTALDFDDIRLPADRGPTQTQAR